MKNKLYYLAGPYTHNNIEIMNEREIEHAKCAVALKDKGYIVYAPIPETSGLVKLGGIRGTSWKDWREHDLTILARCDELLVMMLDGWKESTGVRGEVKFALKNRIPVTFVRLCDLSLLHTDVLLMFDVNYIDELND